MPSQPSDRQRRPSPGRSDSRTRRSLLRAGGLAAAALLAGCSGVADDDRGSPPGTTVTEAAPTDGPDASPTPTDTEEPPSETFPPTPQASETPAGGSLSPSGSWPAYAADAGNTGVGDGPAVGAEPVWAFYTRSTSPLVADGTLYTIEAARERVLVARDAATGEQDWTAPISGGGTGAAPALYDGGLAVQAYSELHGYARDGTPEWTVDVGRGSPGAPVAVDGVVYGCNGSFEGWDASAFAYSTDGEELWSVTFPGDVRSSPAVGDEAVVVPGDGGTVRAFDRATGEPRWTREVGASASTPSVAGGTVYVPAAGRVVALDAADGAEAWTADLEGGAVGPLAVTGEGVVVGGEQVSRLDRADGTEQWTELHGGFAAPTVGDGTVYVGGAGFDQRHIYALDLADGAVRWSRRTEEQVVSDYIVAGVRGAPALVDGALYVAAADGLRAFGPA